MSTPNFKLDQSNTLSLTGEVVGIFNDKDVPSATLCIKPFTLQFTNLSDLHLGEEATIEISISVQSINFQTIQRRQI